MTTGIAARIGFPMIVKPLEAESSHGVVRIDGYSALVDYLGSDARYNRPPLILQEFRYTLPASYWAGINFVEIGLRCALGVENLPDNYRPGAYVLPGQAFRFMLNPLRAGRNLSSRDIPGFLQPAKDPIPHLYDQYLKLRNRARTDHAR